MAYVNDISPGPRVAGGRISVLCVAHEHFGNANRDTLTLALKNLVSRAKQEVDKLRERGFEQRDGRRHALYMGLAYNAWRCME